METNRNPGWIALVAGAGFGVLFGVLGFTGILDAQLGLGFGLICFLVGTLVYLFYARENAVTKTGYASLMLLLTTGLIIPFLLVNQQQQQVGIAATTYDTTLHRGAALFGQYCTPCHGYQGQGIIGPQLNNNPVVNGLTDDDLTRIISAGVPFSTDPSTLSKLQMPAWSNAYGGPLTEEDISYLMAFIRSSNPAYLKQKNLPSTNGFSYVFASLTNATAIADFKTQAASAGSHKPPDAQFVDMSTKTAVTIDAIDNPPQGGTYGWEVQGAQVPNVILKVGTTVTFSNLSATPHNVYSGPANHPDGVFKSSILTQGGADFTYTFTKAGEYPYYCNLHPFMIGWITVK